MHREPPPLKSVWPDGVVVGSRLVFDYSWSAGSGAAFTPTCDRDANGKRRWRAPRTVEALEKWKGAVNNLTYTALYTSIYISNQLPQQRHSEKE
jgi:hypothetical protein